MKVFKITRLAMFAAAMTMVAAGCKRTDLPTPAPTPSDTKLAVAATINGVKSQRPQSAATKLDEGTGSSAAFALGDKIGLYVIPYRNPGQTPTPAAAGALEASGNYVDNMKFTYVQQGADTEWHPDATIFYPTVNADIYAFAPYAADFTPTATPAAYAVTLPTDQSTKATITAADFMTAKSNAVVAAATPQALKFHHRLSKVDVQFKTPSTFKGKIVTSVKGVTLLGFKMDAVMNLTADYTTTIGTATDCPTPATATATSAVGNIKPHMIKDASIGSTTDVFHYEAIVVPQTLTGGLGFVEIELEYNGGAAEKFYYKVPEGGTQEFKAGMEQLIEVSFEKDYELLLGAVTIQDWGTAAAVTGEVVENNVFNDFTLNLPAALATKVAKVKVLCNDGYAGGYSLPAEHTAGEATVKFAFDGSFTSPEYYPYVVENVELYDAGGVRLNATEIYVKELTDKGAATLRMGVKGANSYMVAPGGKVSINAMRAGNDLADTLQFSKDLVSKVKSVRILWQTAKNHGATAGAANMILSSVAYANGVATVTAAAGGSGNAVVAAYDATTGGNILWSWHIWVTATPALSSALPLANQPAAGGDKRFMDRNLGAINATVGNVGAYGMFYQWGRKDPFTPSLGMTNETTSLGAVPIFDASGAALDNPATGISLTTGFKLVSQTADNLADAIKNPMTHYNAGSSWTSNADACNNYWRAPATAPATAGYVDNRGAKGFADPCPAGYRIAANGAYEGFLRNTWTAWSPAGGSNWLGVWWPAAGYRNPGSGVFNSVGVYGYVWSSSPQSAANGYYLNFDYNGNVRPSGVYGRSAGFAVRCVQE